MSNELNLALGQTGLTVTASVYLLGVVKATGIACAEIGVTGVYSGDFTATPNVAGVYDVAFFVGAGTVASGLGQIVWDGAAEVSQTGDAFARVAALNDFDPAADTVAHVTLVDTTTTNTDMRGTDGAYTGTPPTVGAIADQVWDEAMSGHATAGSAGATLTTAASHSTGAGAITWPYTITSSTTGLPIADVDVWVTTDLAGSNVIASGRTNASGIATFYLDAGTVYVWRQKTGYTFTNPDTEVVS